MEEISPAMSQVVRCEDDMHISDTPLSDASANIALLLDAGGELSQAKTGMIEPTSRLSRRAYIGLSLLAGAFLIVISCLMVLPHRPLTFHPMHMQNTMELYECLVCPHCGGDNHTREEPLTAPPKSKSFEAVVPAGATKCLEAGCAAVKVLERASREEVLYLPKGVCNFQLTIKSPYHDVNLYLNDLATGTPLVDWRQGLVHDSAFIDGALQMAVHKALYKGTWISLSRRSETLDHGYTQTLSLKGCTSTEMLVQADNRELDNATVLFTYMFCECRQAFECGIRRLVHATPSHTLRPSSAPTSSPTLRPTPAPTAIPTSTPTPAPTSPTPVPTQAPTSVPTISPKAHAEEIAAKQMLAHELVVKGNADEREADAKEASLKQKEKSGKEQIVKGEKREKETEKDSKAQRRAEKDAKQIRLHKEHDAKAAEKAVKEKQTIKDETAIEESNAKEAVIKEESSKENSAKEANVKQKDALEIRAKEKDAKEQKASEKKAKEQAVKDKREKEAKEKDAKEQAAKEKNAKEKAAEEKSAKEKIAKYEQEKDAKELKEKTGKANERHVKEEKNAKITEGYTKAQDVKEKAAKENDAKKKEKDSKEMDSKENESKEKDSKENDAKEKDMKDREKQAKEKNTKKKADAKDTKECTKYKWTESGVNWLVKQDIYDSVGSPGVGSSLTAAMQQTYKSFAKQDNLQSMTDKGFLECAQATYVSVGRGYCRGVAGANPWTPSSSCVDLVTCGELCDNRCAGFSWSDKPETATDQCQAKGLPRCVVYQGAGMVTSTSSHRQEYTCYQSQDAKEKDSKMKLKQSAQEKDRKTKLEKNAKEKDSKTKLEQNAEEKDSKTKLEQNAKEKDRKTKVEQNAKEKDRKTKLEKNAKEKDSKTKLKDKETDQPPAENTSSWSRFPILCLIGIVPSALICVFFFTWCQRLHYRGVRIIANPNESNADE